MYLKEIKIVINNNKKILKIVNRLISTNKNSNYSNRGKKRKKEKKNQTQLQNKVKYKNNRCFSWISAVSVFSL